MTKPNRWMPLDWGDYWRDTAHLTAAEHGAYLNLLGTYWVSGAPLPDDDERLSRIARTTYQEWQSVRETVRAFFRVENGALHHGRVDREIARAVDVHAGRIQRMAKLNAKRRSRSLSGASNTTSSTTSCATSSTTSCATSSPISSSISSQQSQSQTQTQSQIPLHDSGPSGPAAEAALRGGDVSHTPAQPKALKARIFGPCVTWLAAQTHITEAMARTFTARWCAKFGDGAVLEAFSAAARQSPLDPVPYIEKVLQNGPTRMAGSRDAANIHTRRQREAERAAGDHLAGLRAALGAGSVGALPEPTADLKPVQPLEVDRRV